jgi:hydrogenase maturation protein HypF
VGFRPFVHALADDLGLSGFVGNDIDGVFIEVQGEQVETFLVRLRSQTPPMACVDSIDVTAIVDRDEAGFRIVASESSTGVATTSIPPDTAVCADCLAEMRDPADRRFGYPFIACTNCGPRFTMVAGLPYDRENTSMAAFALCAPCEAEYTGPAKSSLPRSAHSLRGLRPPVVDAGGRCRRGAGRGPDRGNQGGRRIPPRV